MLFLCSSGWQGHNLFYDLLGRVAALYSSLKDAFNNRSNETRLKKQDPALLFLPATAGATQKVPNGYQDSQAALLGGGAPAQEQPQSGLKNHRIMWKVASQRLEVRGPGFHR